MENSLFNKVAFFALNFMLLVCTPLTQAGMLTFDDLEIEDNHLGASVLNASPSYGDFTWDEKFSVKTIGEGNFSETATFGTKLLSNSSYGPNFFISRATPFDFLSVSFGKAGRLSTQVVQFWGYDAFGTEIASTGRFYLNSPGLRVIEPSLSGIYTLKMKTGGGLFAMDNLRFRDTAITVTEAGSLVLLVIGLIGLWAARRRGQLQA